MILLYCDSGLVNLDLVQAIRVEEGTKVADDGYRGGACYALVAKMSNGGTVVLTDCDSRQDANLALVRLTGLLAEHTPSDGNVLYAESLLSSSVPK